jgi:hypothetical protein
MMVLSLLLVLDAGMPAGRAPQAILDDYARAIGGKAAFARHKTVHLKRDIQAQGMGFHGTEERFATSAGQMLVLTTMDSLGKFRQGTDGKVQWAEDPINGLRRLSGAEEEEAQMDSRWDGELELARQFKEVRPAAPPEAPPAGQRWECVELVPRKAQPSVACFDAQTHLRVLQKGTHATPQGQTPYTMRFSDWRESGGIKMPHAEEMKAGALTITSRVVSISYDGKMDARLFALPKGVGAAAAPAPLAKPAQN